MLSIVHWEHANSPILDILEMIPPSVRERLLRLQHENKKLKASAGASGQPINAAAQQNVDFMQSMIDDLKERENELRAANSKANQRIMELESKLEDVPRVPGSREELELKLAEANKKVRRL
jgi:protein HOOK3